MTHLLTAQQCAFYSKNGWLELEELFTSSECAQFPKEFGRDLWRKTPFLKNVLLSRKMAGLALQLTHKPSLRLGLDHHFPPEYFLASPSKMKDLFYIQTLASVVFLQLSPTSPQKPPKMAPLGLFPFPQKQGNALFVDPGLLINWPKTENEGLFLVAYCLPNSVYVHNEKDPAALYLKQFGYGYGDPLKNDTHPLIVR